MTSPFAKWAPDPTTRRGRRQIRRNKAWFATAKTIRSAMDDPAPPPARCPDCDWRIIEELCSRRSCRRHTQEGWDAAEDEAENRTGWGWATHPNNERKAR